MSADNPTYVKLANQIARVLYDDHNKLGLYEWLLANNQTSETRSMIGNVERILNVIWPEIDKLRYQLESAEGVLASIGIVPSYDEKLDDYAVFVPQEIADAAKRLQHG